MRSLKETVFCLISRIFDYSLFFFVLATFFSFSFLFYLPFFIFCLILLIPFLWAPIQAYFLSRFGATLGNYLLRIKVTSRNDSYLSFSEGLKQVFFFNQKRVKIIQKNISSFRIFFTCLMIVLFSFLGVKGERWARMIQTAPKEFSTEGWVECNSDQVAFRVFFPIDPKRESKYFILPNTGKKIVYEEIFTNQDQTKYSLTHGVIPRKWKLAGNVALLKMFVEKLMKTSPDLKLLEQHYIMHRGHRALEYKLSQGDQEIRGRVMIVGNKMYRLMITYLPEQCSTKDQSIFLESFEPF